MTPASSGTYSYTLTCTGDGGSASATATLAATLAAVTVTAHAGGGAMSWTLLTGLAVLLTLQVLAKGRGGRGPHLLIVFLLVTAGGMARADSLSNEAGNAPWLDPFYVGIRFGEMSTHMSSGDIDRSLAGLGYPGIEAHTTTSEPSGTVFVGYELAPHANVEFGYSHRSADVATLNGVVASAASVIPLLQDTTDVVRGYGNIFSLTFSPRVGNRAAAHARSTHR